ncbi:hypothetical protein ABZ934_24880 [Streptomyces sp. NPDC046557]|uniref:hypothetical protein n=1 Tax=Streptomyces sp. NPDC046557 TaxID=3155372 RepID=UPI0033C8FE9A
MRGNCRDQEREKLLGSKCPKLKNKRHGAYRLRQELPPTSEGTRRSFTRGGYESKREAQADLDHIRALLAVADSDDDEGRERIVELLAKVAQDKAPLPDLEETRRRLHTTQSLTIRITVREWLDTWLAAKQTQHSTITLTSDTYTSLLPEVDKAAAEAAARLAPRARPAVAANGTSSTAAPASLPHGVGNDEAPRPAEANRGAK